MDGWIDGWNGTYTTIPTWQEWAETRPEWLKRANRGTQHLYHHAHVSEWASEASVSHARSSKSERSERCYLYYEWLHLFYWVLQNYLNSFFSTITLRMALLLRLAVALLCNAFSGVLLLLSITNLTLESFLVVDIPYTHMKSMAFMQNCNHAKYLPLEHWWLISNDYFQKNCVCVSVRLCVCPCIFPCSKGYCASRFYSVSCLAT